MESLVGPYSAIRLTLQQTPHVHLENAQQKQRRAAGLLEKWGRCSRAGGLRHTEMEQSVANDDQTVATLSFLRMLHGEGGCQPRWVPENRQPKWVPENPSCSSSFMSNAYRMNSSEESADTHDILDQCEDDLAFLRIQMTQALSNMQDTVESVERRTDWNHSLQTHFE
jgi:hypothetical protein